MNVEERLSRALHSTLDNRQPSPGLADRTADALSRTGRRPRWVFGVRLAAAAGMVVVAAMALVLLPGAVRQPISGPAPAISAGTPAGPPSAWPPASGGLVRYSSAGLSDPAIVFEYPSEWHASGQFLNMHYVSILGYVGTGTGDAYCTNLTPGPSDNWLSSTECGSHETVDPGQMLLKISTQDGPPGNGPIDPADAGRLQPGESYVTVAGVPAIYSESREGDRLTLGWTISMPFTYWATYNLTATIRDPGADAMRGQVQRLIASVGFDPAPAALDPADEPKVAAAAVARLKAENQILTCFPGEPGASATTTVTRLPNFAQPLAKPLPATCSTAIEPTAIGMWKLTLTLSWTADTDRTAGSSTTAVYLSADGTPGTSLTTGDVPYTQ
jgi:hypothetical protein